MSEPFKIFIRSLEEGQTEKLSFDAEPDFFDIQEKDLQFTDPVHVKGKAYLTDDHLVLQLSANTVATLKCSICNGPCKVPLAIENVYFTEPLQEIQNGAFNFQETLREALLLEIPNHAECADGACPERTSMKSFMKEESQEKKDDVYFPFSDLKM